MNIDDLDNTSIRRCELCGKICSVFWPDGQRLPPGLGGSPRTGNWNQHIARKYCPECAQKRRREDNRYWQQQNRRTRKQEKRHFNKAIAAADKARTQAEGICRRQEAYISELHRNIRFLENENRRLRQEQEESYQQGRTEGKTEARRGLIGAALARLAHE